MNKRLVGSEYESRACEYVGRNGGRIICRNYRCRLGEIDIIAREGRCIAFIEVKYRRNRRYGYPEEAVDSRKIRTICRVSDQYRKRYGIAGTVPCRYDVIAIEDGPGGYERIHWYKNAFQYYSR